MIKIQPIRFIKNICNLFIQFILLSTGYIGPTAVDFIDDYIILTPINNREAYNIDVSLVQKQSTHVFATYTKVEGQVVHSPSMKLMILLNKLKADFLVHVKAGINSELTKVPMAMYYERALVAFRNEVSRKNPPQMSNVPDRL